MGLAFYERQLSAYLTAYRDQVFFVADEGGFSLVMWDGKRRHVLLTQRGQVRRFKDLTKAAAFVHEAGLSSFRVCMSYEALSVELKHGSHRDDESGDDEDLDGYDDDEPQRPRSPPRPKRPIRF
ncbi:hypothetical protein Q8W90_28405 [Pseudomonas aeruginosa]|uniref:hypothetical protein n=1 Tax=Pseudomonas aeruginosa TaxID=287 RepID=UPI001A301C19|nr:hypothetical protein [Pseudomonas aeruginosa]MBG7282120.1 hypothetical protein [Pseudomonas aeruginosa]MDI3829428.1 hypothetical protein [Pseudomonas aeruginosa]MDU0686155.1 hypothetical protein [Pseudomonas aeruginosa]HBN9565034.1 hypothetical protein [Pseudomonas aeruginosa]HBO3132164.1 hypothetical protein [Pseudomonas aeruginosa]